MTFERKKAIAIMIATLIAGILIGVLGTGIFARQHYRHAGGQYFDKSQRSSRYGFAEKILRVTDADSVQAKQMRPVIERTMTKIDTLQNQTNAQVRALTDSMIVELKPFLKVEQLEKLNGFTKNKMNHGGHRRSHR
jgi:hypothetical protein